MVYFTKLSVFHNILSDVSGRFGNKKLKIVLKEIILSYFGIVPAFSWSD